MRAANRDLTFAGVIVVAPGETDESISDEHIPLGEGLQAVPHQGRADTAPVEFGQHAHRTEDSHIDQASRGSEQATGEHDVPDDQTVMARSVPR